jgi:hypothetical protein
VDGGYPRYISIEPQTGVMMNKFSNYTDAQLEWAAADIKEVLDIWKDNPDSSYLREKELELDDLRDEMMSRQVEDIARIRRRLLRTGLDGLVANMMATWMVREGISADDARERASNMYWGD